jgi:hypothetical protein
MPQRDQFPARGAGASPREFFPITPDNSNDLAQVPQAIWVGGAGNLEIIDSVGTTIVITNLPAGQYWIGSPVRVKATNTTATCLIGAV